MTILRFSNPGRTPQRQNSDRPMVGESLRVHSDPENDLCGCFGRVSVALRILLLSGRGGSRSRAFSSR